MQGLTHKGKLIQPQSKQKKKLGEITMDSGLRKFPFLLSLKLLGNDICYPFAIFRMPS